MSLTYYAFGLDKDHLDFVVADSYEVTGDFITFKRGSGNYFSIAKARVNLVGELDDNKELPYKPL